MVVPSMLRNDAVDEKSIMLGGIGMTIALAAVSTDSEIMPSAGGGSRITTSNSSATPAIASPILSMKAYPSRPWRAM